MRRTDRRSVCQSRDHRKTRAATNDDRPNDDVPSLAEHATAGSRARPYVPAG